MKKVTLLFALLMFLISQPTLAQDQTPSTGDHQAINTWERYVSCVHMEQDLVNQPSDPNSPYAWQNLSFNKPALATLMVSVTFYHCDGRADILAISSDSIEKVLKTISQMHTGQMYWKSENVIMSYLYEVTGYYDKEMKLPRYFIKNFEVNDYNGIQFSESLFAQNQALYTQSCDYTKSDTSFDQIQGWMSGASYSAQSSDNYIVSVTFSSCSRREGLLMTTNQPLSALVQSISSNLQQLGQSVYWDPDPNTIDNKTFYIAGYYDTNKRVTRYTIQFWPRPTS